MDLKQLLKIITWTLTGGALVLLWISIRTETQQWEYTVAALVFWGLAMMVNYLLKKHNEKKQKED